MNHLKVVTKLQSKVRHRTVFMNEQGFHSTFIFGDTISANLSFIFKQKRRTDKLRLHLLNLCVTKTRTIPTKEWTRQNSCILIGSKTYLCKRRLEVNNTLNDRALHLRSEKIFFKEREKHKIIRPLLDFKRENITMVCKDFKMPVYPDQSNKSVQYLRNRIRKQILPSLKYFINPQVESSLFKLAELLNKEQFFLYSVLRNTSANMSLSN